MEFLAEKQITGKNSHPLLIYRSTVDTDNCFKFCWKYTGQKWHSYICLGCQNAKDHGKNLFIKSIHVSLDYTSFLTDPETLIHKCTGHAYTFKYLAADIQQEVRLVFNEAIIYF